MLIITETPATSHLRWLYSQSVFVVWLLSTWLTSAIADMSTKARFRCLLSCKGILNICINPIAPGTKFDIIGLHWNLNEKSISNMMEAAFSIMKLSLFSKQFCNTATIRFLQPFHNVLFHPLSGTGIANINSGNNLFGLNKLHKALQFCITWMLWIWNSWKIIQSHIIILQSNDHNTAMHKKHCKNFL